MSPKNTFIVRLQQSSIFVLHNCLAVAIGKNVFYYYVSLYQLRESDDKKNSIRIEQMSFFKNGKHQFCAIFSEDFSMKKRSNDFKEHC